ncbi:MAG: 2-keto-4-pentenoate hydratase [Mesonia hippocampi]|uniref:2-keto-4-pentenoate hydratase n=1 Tax=Mesonia hippocampi TaxID=1628250 RepID=UPI003F9A2414
MDIIAIAEQLFNAEKNKTACAPIRTYLEEKDLASAYKIQQLNIDKKVAQGAKTVGKKIGLTSFKVQEQLGVDQPDFGILLAAMQLQNKSNFPYSLLMQPKAETEIAFVLKEDLTAANPTLEDIKNAIDYAVIAVEIVGSRIENWNISITDTIADNASSSHFILGDKKVSLDSFDVINSPMEMHINNQLVSTGDGTSCLGNPLEAVVWLANTMIALGNPLKKGEIILSGALGPMANLNPKDTVKASIKGLGEVSFSTSA